MAIDNDPSCLKNCINHTWSIMHSCIEFLPSCIKGRWWCRKLNWQGRILFLEGQVFTNQEMVELVELQSSFCPSKASNLAEVRSESIHYVANNFRVFDCLTKALGLSTRAWILIRYSDIPISSDFHNEHRCSMMLWEYIFRWGNKGASSDFHASYCSSFVLHDEWIDWWADWWLYLTKNEPISLMPFPKFGIFNLVFCLCYLNVLFFLHDVI